MSRHKRLLFLVPSSPWYHSPLSWGCLSLILSAKWQMEKLFATEKGIFYQTSYNWGPLNFNLPAKHWQKRRKSLNRTSCKVASGISMFLVNTQSIDDKLARANERVLKQIPPWSLRPAGEGCRAEGNLGQEPGSLYSRSGSGPDSLGHGLLVMSPFSVSVAPPVQWKGYILLLPPGLWRKLIGKLICYPDRWTKSCLWN